MPKPNDQDAVTRRRGDAAKKKPRSSAGMPEQPAEPCRSAQASASVEDYIKAVYHLQAQRGRAATRELSRLLGVQMASVTGMMKQLHGAGLVDHKRY
jgi:hypothetical protein